MTLGMIAFCLTFAGCPALLLALVHRSPEHASALRLAGLGAAIGGAVALACAMLAPAGSGLSLVGCGMVCGALAGLLGGTEAESLGRARGAARRGALTR